MHALAGGRAAPAPVNTTSFERREVAEAPDGSLVFVEAPSCGIGHAATPPAEVKVTQSSKSIVLENAHLRAELSPGGTLLSLVVQDAGREALAGPGNVLEIYEDRPTAYDAWDVDPFHLETVRECPPATSHRIITQSPLRAEVVFEGKIGSASSIRQVVRLDAGAKRLEFHTDVDWHESNRMLKVAFPVNARAMNATYEMQFAAVERPTHYNTPYDLARYEVPGHKWADLSEHGFGVALLSESKYGFSTFGNTMRLSLLRSSKRPDPQADIGRQSFAYAIYPHAEGWREAGVVAEGYRFNVPLLWLKGGGERRSFASVDEDMLVIDTIKKAEDFDAIILRLYEPHGARGLAKARVDLPFRSAVSCNILEEEGAALRTSGGAIDIPFLPYQIVSIKLKQ